VTLFHTRRYQLLEAALVHMYKFLTEMEYDRDYERSQIVCFSVLYTCVGIVVFILFFILLYRGGSPTAVQASVGAVP